VKEGCRVNLSQYRRGRRGKRAGIPQAYASGNKKGGGGQKFPYLSPRVATGRKRKPTQR